MSANDKNCKKYEPIPANWDQVGKNSVASCCLKDPNEDPGKGCDCCYDSWSDQLKKKQDEFGRKSEEAIQAKAKLDFSKGRRDGFKKWQDGLLQLDEQSKDICSQFSLIISQVNKICSNSGYTVKAVEILFCMIRDFYSQLDKINAKYESVQNCIKYLDKSIMVPGQGFMKCLESYKASLDVVLKTKEDIIRQIMDIIRLANMVHEDVCTPFGLACILEEWQCRLNCEGDDEQPCDPCKEKNDDKQGPGQTPGTPCGYDSCEIMPQFTFPVASNSYTQWVINRYKKSVDEVNTDSQNYLNASKDKEAIASCISSLKDAVTITDPKGRCS